jgi:hypothetical protein
LVDAALLNDDAITSLLSSRTFSGDKSDSPPSPPSEGMVLFQMTFIPD